MNAKIKHIGDYEVHLTLQSKECIQLVEILKPFSISKLRNHLGHSYGDEELFSFSQSLVNLLERFINL